MEASMTDSCSHDWEIVYVSVRFSNNYEQSLYEEYVKTLRKDYTKAYQPRTSHWGVVILHPSGRRSTNTVWGRNNQWASTQFFLSANSLSIPPK